MRLDEGILLFAIFLLIEMALVLLCAPLLALCSGRGRLTAAIFTMSMAALLLSLVIEHMVAALIVVAVLQP